MSVRVFRLSRRPFLSASVSTLGCKTGRLPREPYADRADLDEKYYRRAPDAALRRPGTAWMT